MRDEVTTETEESAIARPANAGGSDIPQQGNKMPAARGTPRRLYPMLYT
eukprot:CAMPEP_0114154894 /NCGR_PEP_ID=MMETSP0043_2-20121206/25165_1 /TAXON_ID=464988 /ORGANISM="Hemiselmis andersenii, Strain CCMP644" /LENGTH=48 /DNA_ID= /DNA_START= /DNA_END= /DNA_ORIENTATION=